MERFRPYFSFRGRSGRARYWLTTLGVYALFLAGAAVSFMAGPVGAVLFLVVMVAGLWASLAVAVRRLHDRNKSWWWLLPMYGPVILLSVMGEVASMSSPEAGAGFFALSLPFSIWMLVDLGILKGTTGENRFGYDPLQPSVAAVFS